MPIGTAVRRAIGPLEPVAIRFYRSLFIDLEAVATFTAEAAPDAKSILEIGCGDGAMAAALLRQMPEAHLLGIDPGTPSPGRMFDGDRSRVEFDVQFTSKLIAEDVDPFDLVLLVDVLHHVSRPEREAVLLDAARLTRPGGTLVIEEWERRKGLGNKTAFIADRYVSGDETVHFMSPEELDGLISGALPGWSKTRDVRTPPRRANRFQAFRRPTDT